MTDNVRHLVECRVAEYADACVNEISKDSTGKLLKRELADLSKTMTAAG